MCKASLTQHYLKMKLVDFGLWRDLLTSMAVASNPESSKEQIPYYRLLIRTKNQMATRVKSRERDCQSYTA